MTSPTPAQMTQETQTSAPIVCGTDFTESARGAASVAAALAHARGCPLELVHVQERASLWSINREQRRRDELAVTEALRDEADRLFRAHGAQVITRQLEGSPATRLVEAASESNAQMIVVAASGPTPSIFRVGGTAERVVQAARITALLVRDPAPLLQWLAGGPLAASAFVADDAAGDSVVKQVAALRATRACNVTFVRAYYSNEEATRLGLSPRPLTAPDDEIEAVLCDELRTRVGELGGEGAVDFTTAFAIGRLADALLAHPAVQASKLLVVGNNQARGFARLSSVAANVLHLTDASVLVAPQG